MEPKVGTQGTVKVEAEAGPEGTPRWKQKRAPGGAGVEAKEGTQGTLEWKPKWAPRGS